MHNIFFGHFMRFLRWKILPNIAKGWKNKKMSKNSLKKLSSHFRNYFFGNKTLIFNYGNNLNNFEVNTHTFKKWT